MKFLVKGLFGTRLYNTGDKVSDLKMLLSECTIDFCQSEYFAYSVDIYKSWKINLRQMANCPVDYALLLDNSLEELKMTSENGEYGLENNCIVDIIADYVIRLEKAVSHSNLPNKKNVLSWMDRIRTQKAETFEEALQRILIVNQLMWQTRHIQVGLGRMDMILEKYIRDDMSDEYLDTVLSDFLKVLHNYYWLKSEEMPGDTGQIIILGGVEL